MRGSLASTCLYYPFIDIPEPVLVHSLLFKDRIKRIIPPMHAVRDSELEIYSMPNVITKKILGYEFIIEADYSASRKDIAEDFVSLLDDASNAKNPLAFAGLFGKDYLNRFNVKKSGSTFGMQHFVYADKFDNQVFSTLGRIGWMKHADYHVCELRNELCNVYMTLLAAAISKKTREPILTGIVESESILRNSIFRQYFSRHLPPQLQGNDENLQELCLTLLMSADTKTKIKQQPIDQILSFNEAVMLRASLEKKREDFCKTIDTLVGKVSAIGPNNPNLLITYEVQEVIEAARNYKNKIDEELKKQVSTHRKDIRKYVRTGISLCFPAIGKLVDNIVTGSSPTIWAEMGTAISLVSFLAMERKPTMVAQSAPNSRENAFLFLNNLWSLQEQKRTS